MPGDLFQLRRRDLPSKKMPPKRSRTTRATRAAAAATQDVAAQKEPIVPEASTQVQVDGENDQNGKVEEPQATTTVADPIPNGTQVNGKPAAPKSAAQKKREKRKQKRREGSVMSEVSDAESVNHLWSEFY